VRADLWVIVVAIGVVTFLLRLSFIALFSYVEPPAFIQTYLRYVPVAVLAALSAPPLFYRDGAIDVSTGNPELFAGLVAAVVAWRTENVLATLVAGMGVLALLELVAFA